MYVVLLSNLLTSMCDFMACDRMVQRVYSSKAGQCYPPDKSLTCYLSTSFRVSRSATPFPGSFILPPPVANEERISSFAPGGR